METGKDKMTGKKEEAHPPIEAFYDERKGYYQHKENINWGTEEEDNMRSYQFSCRHLMLFIVCMYLYFFLYFPS